MINRLKDKVLSGESITEKEAVLLSNVDDKESLYEAAHQITRQLCGHYFDSCSIINAKSGRCPENCKWCAQSSHYHTQIEKYDLIDEVTGLEIAQKNQQAGIRRIALVTSGKQQKGDKLLPICAIFEKLKVNTRMQLCASLGLLSKNELIQLQKAGVQRYHCNLETAPSYFNTLCSTHTQEQKIETIRAAQDIGMDVCSGGIIGMGETMLQRIELAFKLKELNIQSIPINILQPIKGTPLENQPPLEPEEILTTVALFRFINPTAFLRFAGGRASICKEIQQKLLYIGINSAIMGDMLTTVGSKTDEDKILFQASGYTL